MASEETVVKDDNSVLYNSAIEVCIFCLFISPAYILLILQDFVLKLPGINSKNYRYVTWLLCLHSYIAVFSYWAILIQYENIYSMALAKYLVNYHLFIHILIFHS